MKTRYNLGNPVFVLLNGKIINRNIRMITYPTQILPSHCDRITEGEIKYGLGLEIISKDKNWVS